MPRVDRHDMIEPRDAADSSDPTLANDPIENAESALPTDPIDSTEPIDPIESTDPVLPMLSTEFSDRIDHSDERDDDMPPSWPTTSTGGATYAESPTTVLTAPDTVRL